MITKILAGAALVSWAGFACVAAPAPAGTEPNAFSALSWTCQPTTPADSAKEIDRGIRDGLRPAPAPAPN